MKISALDSRKAATTARPLHLRHPSDNSILLWSRKPVGQPGDDDYDPGLPVRVWVFGSENSEAQKNQKEIRLRRMQEKEPPRNRAQRRAGTKVQADAEKDDRSFEEMTADLAESSAPLISHFENCDNDDDQPLGTSFEEKVWFLRLQTINGGGDVGQMSFLEQVLAFSADRSNTLGNIDAS